MASMDTVDSLTIRAPAASLYATILDYPRMHEWFPACSVTLLDGSEVREGARLRHEVRTMGLVTRFVRTIRHLAPGQRIEETYDEGDLFGTGVWTFSPDGESATASFHCAVAGRSLATNFGFLLTGATFHKRFYRQLLAALARRCAG